MHLRKLTALGIAVILSMAIVAPAFAQSADEKDYKAITDERDQGKRKSLMESFISKYATSSHTPDVEQTLIATYLGNKEYAQVLKLADTFMQTQGSADAKIKLSILAFAITGAKELDKKDKAVEYADKALAIDPNYTPVLMTMSRVFAENAPKDEKGKAEAMDKALGYAKRVRSISTKPANLDDAEWANLQGRLHSILGLIYSNQSKWPEAATELSEFIKTNPTDVVSQYRLGLATYTMTQTTAATLQEVNTAATAAQKKDPADPTLNVYANQLDKLLKQLETQRDIALDAMAKAMALAGPGSTLSKQAEPIATALFKAKTGSPDGLTQYVADKKHELDALTPVAPAAVPTPARGGPGGAAGGAGGGGGAGGRGGR